MKDKRTPVDKKPSYAVFAKDTPLVGMPFKYTIISKDSERLNKLSKPVICVTNIGTDAYRVETEDIIYYTAIEYSS